MYILFECKLDYKHNEVFNNDLTEITRVSLTSIPVQFLLLINNQWPLWSSLEVINSTYCTQKLIISLSGEPKSDS